MILGIAGLVMAFGCVRAGLTDLELCLQSGNLFQILCCRSNHETNCRIICLRLSMGILESRRAHVRRRCLLRKQDMHARERR
jgi:hypothetical protein